MNTWQLMATVLALADDPAYIMDRKAIIAYANPAMHEAVRWPPDADLRGQSLNVLIPPSELPERIVRRDEYFARPQPRPSVVNPLRFQRADGTLLTARSSASPIPDTRFIVVKLNVIE